MSSEKREAALVGSAQEGSPDVEPRSRRALLKAFGAAAAGAVAGGVLTPTQALAHGGFHQDFDGPDPAIHGNNTGDGPGVEGTAVHGPAVVGQSLSGDGVHGWSEGGTAVRGHTLHGRGIVGIAEHDGVGVLALSSSGAGVVTESLEGDALYVMGRARFTMGGNRIIEAGQDGGTVFHEGVTVKSHITVTLNGNPNSVATEFPAVVQWVERKPGLGFVIHLTRKVARPTPFSFLILELDF